MNKKHVLSFSALFIFIVFFFITFGKLSIIKIYHLTKDRNTIQAYNERIKAENIRLKEEISSIKRDGKYIERGSVSVKNYDDIRDAWRWKMASDRRTASEPEFK